MLEKIKKHKFLIGIIVISFIYLLLVNVQNPYFAYEATDDDYYILNTAKSILDFKWLGIYNGRTLSKGPGAPIFIAIVNLIGLTYSQAHFLLYLGGSILLIYTLAQIVYFNFY